MLNVEVLSVRHLVIGDLDHDEYDSIIPVLGNVAEIQKIYYVSPRSMYGETSNE